MPAYPAPEPRLVADSVMDLPPSSSADPVLNPWGAPRTGVERAVCVDSRDRDFERYPSPTSYRVRLPAALHNVSAARLASAEVPATFYVFSAARRNVTLRVLMEDSRDVTIPDGNYNTTTLCAALRTAMDATFPGTTFTASVDSTTLRLTLTPSPLAPLAVDTRAADGVVDPSKPTDWGLAYYLGFDRDAVTGDGSGIVTGTRVVLPNPITYLMLSIDELDRVDEAQLYGSGGTGRAFAKIPLNVDSNQYVFFDKAHLTHNIIAPPIRRLEYLTVSLRLHDGTPLDFNGGEHSLTLHLVATDAR